MDGAFFWSLAVIAAILVGMGKGGLPVVGMLSVPVLALVMSPVAAAGLLLPVYVVSDMFGLYAYRHAFDRRVLAIMVPSMTIGVVLGYFTASVVSEDWVTVLIGVIGVVFALNLLIRHKVQTAPRRAEVPAGLFWGSVTGFVSFVSHSGGPPYQVYTLPLGLRKAVFAGTSTILFAYVNAIKLIPYYLLGQFSTENLHVAVLLMPAAALAASSSGAGAAADNGEAFGGDDVVDVFLIEGAEAAAVSVATRYLPEQSSPEQNRFAFAYTVTIRNSGDVTAQLVARQWLITDAEGRQEEVRGLAVPVEGAAVAARMRTTSSTVSDAKLRAWPRPLRRAPTGRRARTWRCASCG